MRSRVINILLGVFLILVAIWEFDRYDSNKIVTSSLLVLSGLLNILAEIESKPIQTIRSFLLYFVLLIVIFAILKVLFFG